MSDTTRRRDYNGHPVNMSAGVRVMADEKKPEIEWVTTHEAAAIMETTIANVTYLCRVGAIHCEKFGRAWKVSKADAKAYIRRAKEGDTTPD